MDPQSRIGSWSAQFGTERLETHRELEKDVPTATSQSQICKKLSASLIIPAPEWAKVLIVSNTLICVMESFCPSAIGLIHFNQRSSCAHLDSKSCTAQDAKLKTWVTRIFTKPRFNTSAQASSYCSVTPKNWLKLWTSNNAIKSLDLRHRPWSPWGRQSEEGGIVDRNQENTACCILVNSHCPWLYLRYNWLLVDS
jgi:hypothetical protein